MIFYRDLKKQYIDDISLYIADILNLDSTNLMRGCGSFMNTPSNSYGENRHELFQFGAFFGAMVVFLVTLSLQKPRKGNRDLCTSLFQVQVLQTWN